MRFFLCTVYGVRCMVYSVQCTVYGVQNQKKPPGGDFSELIVSYLAVNRGSFT